MAPQHEELFGDLPVVTKEFLKTLTTEEILHFKNMVKFYESLVDRPEVLEWLKKAREEEIALLDDGIKLVRSGQTIGKFMWWALATIIGAAVLGSQLGDYLAKFLALVTRGGK